MALIDQPEAWILRLFEMEEREGRGADCARFPQGTRPAGLPLSAGERVFGTYKGKYHFTPESLIVADRGKAERIPWADVRSCSSRHGEGKAFSDLILADGRAVRVPVGEMATGHSGRISQLYHQMIERHGRRAAMGRPLMTAADFFSQAADDHSIAPNLEPHPPLGAFRDAVREMEQSGGARVFVELVQEDEELVAKALVVVSPKPIEFVSPVAESLGADEVVPADDRVLRLLGQIPQGFSAWYVMWD